MTAYDCHNQPLKAGDRIFFTGIIERIEEDEPPLRKLHVRPDQQPDGYIVVAEMHPKCVELLIEES